MSVPTADFMQNFLEAAAEHGRRMRTVDEKEWQELLESLPSENRFSCSMMVAFIMVHECIESHPSHLTELAHRAGHSCGRDVRQRLLKEADRQAGFISVETGTTVETAANVAHALSS